MLMITFITRDRKTMMTLINTYIKSNQKYCSIIWYCITQEDINKIERIRKTFTSEMDGMERKNSKEEESATK